MVPPLRGFLGNQDTASGASNQATQLLEMIDGAGGGYQPTIGEPLNVFHHPDLYSSAYLLKLMYFIHNDQIPPEFSGVLSPSGNRPLPETNVDLLTTIINKTASPALSAVLKTFHLETMSKSQLDMLCAKMESFIGGRILTKTQGANAVQIAHLNNVAMGMTQEGLELDGMAAASEYYFGVDLTHLTLAQKIILDGLIQGPSAYSPFRYHTLTQEDIARGYYEMVDGSRHSIDIKEVFDVRDLSAKANQQLVYIGYDENPAKNRAINGILPILVKKDFFDGKNITASQVAEEIRKTSFINHLPPEISENSIPPGSGHRALAEIIGNGVKPGQPGYIAPNYDIYYDARSGTYLVNLSPSHRADTSIPQPINVEQLATETTSSSFNTNLETYFDQIIKTNQGNGNTFLVNLPKDSPISQVRLPTLEIYNESTDRVEKHLGAAVKFVNAYGTVEGQFADSPLLQYGAIAPGSSMKPFVISWLLQHGVKMTDTFSSAPVKMGIDGKPLLNALENWDPKLNNAGYVNLQVAVIGSMNVPIHRAVIKAFQDFPGGPEAAFRDFQAYLEKFGIAYSVPVTNPQTGVTTFVEATDVSQVPQGSIGDGYIYELFNRFPTAVAKFANADMVDSEGKGVWFDQVHDKNTIDAIIQVRQAMMDDTIRNQKINGVGLWPLTVLEDSKGGTTFWKTGTNASIVNGVQGPVTLDVWTAYKQPGSDHYDVAFMLVKGQDVASTVKNPDGSTRVIYSNVNLDARLGTDQNGAAWASTIDAPVLYYLVNDLSRRSSGNLAQGVITTNMH